jgi:hypothetical protein
MVVQSQEQANGHASHLSRRSSLQFPFTDFVAATPDARFIYDAVDAAKSLLSVFNSFVDPITTFRFMPLRYYLYVIYSACFLYKARSTGVLGGERGSIKRMIGDAVERLQKASACANDVGDRYSRLIRLLWRKAPNPGASGSDPTTNSNAPQSAAGAPMMDDTQTAFELASVPASINAFSWLDLSAIGDFATNNNSISGSLMDQLDQFDDSSGDPFSNFDPNLTNGHLGWNGLNTPDIIF